jgi:hypothetical protein
VDQDPLGDDPLTLELGNGEGDAGNVAHLQLTLSMGHSAGQVSGDLTFDPLLLSFEDFELSSTFAGWTSQVLAGTGTLHVDLRSSTECLDPLNVEIGTVAFSIAAGAVSGSGIPVGVTATTISNLEGLSYSHLNSGGAIQVTGPAEPTPTPTADPTTTSTPTPTATIDEVHPADFDGDRTVDQADLLLFLETWRQETNRP